MKKNAVMVILAILIALGSSAIGYRLGYRAYERSITANICMARYADDHGGVAWMYVGDDRCSKRQREAGKLLIFE